MSFCSAFGCNNSYKKNKEYIDFLLFNSSNISKIKCLRKEEKNKIHAIVYEIVYGYY